MKYLMSYIKFDLHHNVAVGLVESLIENMKQTHALLSVKALQVNKPSKKKVGTYDLVSSRNIRSKTHLFSGLGIRILLRKIYKLL